MILLFEEVIFLEETNARIESETEVKAYLQNLRFALNNGAKINFQINRRTDDNKDEKFTNRYTINILFPNENPIEALKRELLSLGVEDYIQTVKRLPISEEK